MGWGRGNGGRCAPRTFAECFSFGPWSGYAGVTVEALRGSGSESQGKTETGEDGAFRLEGLRGGDYQLRSLRTLKPGGIMVSTVPVAAEGLREEAERLGVRAELILVEADHAGMQAIADLVGEGKLRAHIAEIFPLSEAARAHEAGETNRTAGKLVLVVGEEG